MSELPERLKDAISDPKAFEVTVKPRTYGLHSGPGGVAWEVNDSVWSLPQIDDTGAGAEHCTHETPAGFGKRWSTLVVDSMDPPTTHSLLRSPEDVLDAWNRGELILDSASLRAISEDCMPGVEVLAGVRAMPLRTATLPPATHTNTYFVGRSATLIVDPGTPYDEEMDRLMVSLGHWEQAYGAPAAIFLTHHHDDHVSGAEELRMRTGLPIWAHEATAERVSFSVDRLIEAGEKFGHWETIHTPGHAPGHLCLWNAKTRQLVLGDMLASVGTIVIEPNDGDMALYLSSLEHLRTLDALVAYPAHGEHMFNPQERIAGYINHRRWREFQIYNVLSGQGEALGEVTAKAYTDVASNILWLAEMQALSHLLKLEQEGRAKQCDGLWSLANT